MNESQMKDKIAEQVSGFPSVSAAAASWGFTRAYLHDVLKGRRGVSDALARKVGYCKKISTKVQFVKS